MAAKTADKGTPRPTPPLHSPHPDDSYNRTHAHAHAQADWEWLLDTGLVANRNPAPAPEAIAAREANQRLFAAIARSRYGIW
jgi:hypothetical protein